MTTGCFGDIEPVRHDFEVNCVSFIHKLYFVVTLNI